MITDSTKYAGDSWSWTEEIPDYPATDGYTLKYFLKLKDNKPVILTADADGADYSFAIASSITSPMPEGTYNYIRTISKPAAGDIPAVDITYDAGTVPILPNLRLSGTDARSYWVRIHDNLKDAYERLSKQEVSEVTIDGKTWTYANRAELLKEINSAKLRAGIETGTRTGNKKHYGNFSNY